MVSVLSFTDSMVGSADIRAYGVNKSPCRENACKTGRKLKPFDSCRENSGGTNAPQEKNKGAKRKRGAPTTKIKVFLNFALQCAIMI